MRLDLKVALKLLLRCFIAAVVTIPVLIVFVIYLLIEFAIDGDISRHDAAGTIASWWLNWVSLGSIKEW